MHQIAVLRERQGAALHPLNPFLKEGVKNPKNFQKVLLYNTFLKVFGVLRTFANFAAGKFAPSESENVFKKVLGRRRPCLKRTDKPKFEDQLSRDVPNENAPSPLGRRGV